MAEFNEADLIRVWKMATYERYPELWPTCTVPDCHNKICFELSDELCYPHLFNLPMDSNGNAIHLNNCPCIDCQNGDREN